MTKEDIERLKNLKGLSAEEIKKEVAKAMGISDSVNDKDERFLTVGKLVEILKNEEPSRLVLVSIMEREDHRTHKVMRDRVRSVIRSNDQDGERQYDAIELKSSRSPESINIFMEKKEVD